MKKIDYDKLKTSNKSPQIKFKSQTSRKQLKNTELSKDNIYYIYAPTYCKTYSSIRKKTTQQKKWKNNKKQFTEMKLNNNYQSC